MQRALARDTLRKGHRLYRRTGRVPALSTQEAAALVMGIIEAQRRSGLSLDQINWQGYCRDSAVYQVVAQQFPQWSHQLEEIA